MSDAHTPAAVIAPTPESRATLAIAQATHVVIAKAIDQFDMVAAGLDELERRHADVVYPVHTPQGLAQARAARAEIREPRYKVQNLRAEVITSLEQASATVRERVDPMIERMKRIEAPVHQQIVQREAEIEEGREQRRQANVAIQAEIDGMRGKAIAFVGVDVDLAQIRAAKSELEARVLDPELFGRRLAEAEAVRVETIGVLSTLLAREEAMVEQRAALRRQQEELDARRASADEAMEREKRLHAEELERLKKERLAKEEADAAVRRQQEDQEVAERRRKEEDERAARDRQREADRASTKKLNKGAPRLLEASRDLVKACSGYAALAAPLQGALAEVQIAIQLCTE